MEVKKKKKRYGDVVFTCDEKPGGWIVNPVLEGTPLAGLFSRLYDQTLKPGSVRGHNFTMEVRNWPQQN